MRGELKRGDRSRIYLKAIANSEDGDTQIKDLWINVWRVFIIHGVGRTG